MSKITSEYIHDLQQEIRELKDELHNANAVVEIAMEFPDQATVVAVGDYDAHVGISANLITRLKKAALVARGEA